MIDPIRVLILPTILFEMAWMTLIPVSLLLWFVDMIFICLECSSVVLMRICWVLVTIARPMHTRLTKPVSQLLRPRLWSGQVCKFNQEYQGYGRLWHYDVVYSHSTYLLDHKKMCFVTGTQNIINLQTRVIQWCIKHQLLHLFRVYNICIEINGHNRRI